MKTLEDLKNYLIEEAEYKPTKVNNMTPEELFEAYLTWNGITVYTPEYGSLQGCIPLAPLKTRINP